MRHLVILMSFPYRLCAAWIQSNGILNGAPDNISRSFSHLPFTEGSLHPIRALLPYLGNMKHQVRIKRAAA
jgi:hypothetical protein